MPTSRRMAKSKGPVGVRAGPAGLEDGAEDEGEDGGRQQRGQHHPGEAEQAALEALRHLAIGEAQNQFSMIGDRAEEAPQVHGLTAHAWSGGGGEGRD
jgi:hypothetical protein